MGFGIVSLRSTSRLVLELTKRFQHLGPGLKMFKNT